MKVLIIVDMQNDFIDGALGTGEAQAIVPAVAEKIKGAIGQKEIIFTMDTHHENYLDTQEGKYLPVSHCIKDSTGWRLRKDLVDILSDEGLEVDAVMKATFGSASLAMRLAEEHKSTPIEEIELAGLCTDICIISNALLLKAFLPEVSIAVDASCCAGVTPESHENALKAMKMCQIEIRNHK